MAIPSVCAPILYRNRYAVANGVRTLNRAIRSCRMLFFVPWVARDSLPAIHHGWVRQLRGTQSIAIPQAGMRIRVTPVEAVAAPPTQCDIDGFSSFLHELVRLTCSRNWPLSSPHLWLSPPRAGLRQHACLPPLFRITIIWLIRTMTQMPAGALAPGGALVHGHSSTHSAPLRVGQIPPADSKAPPKGERQPKRNSNTKGARVSRHDALDRALHASTVALILYRN